MKHLINLDLNLLSHADCKKTIYTSNHKIKRFEVKFIDIVAFWINIFLFINIVKIVFYLIKINTNVKL